MSIQIQLITTSDMLQQAFNIRREVFVIEQMVSEIEEYDQEDISTHFIAMYDGLPVGTARYRTTPNGIKLERFAILKSFRSRSVGSAILQHMLNELSTFEGLIYLHAQLTAMGLYSKFGFEAIGEQFDEAGIQHYKMTYQKA